MIQLGSKVKDSITGFTGIAIARTVWLYGCVRITIESMDLKDGKPIDPLTIDEQRCELLEELKPVVSKSSSAKSGGPQRDPKPPGNPSR